MVNPDGSSADNVEYKSITPTKAVDPIADNSFGLSSEDLQSVDSMLDPGMTNASFQAQKSADASSTMLSNNPTSTSKKPVKNPAKKPGKKPGKEWSTSNESSPDSTEGKKLTHVTSSGEAHMVDVGAKESTKRVAIASAVVSFTNTKPFRLISENANKKGDVLGVARVAGIMASKRTADLIPLCHPIAISKVEVQVQLQDPESASFGFRRNRNGAVGIHAVVECVGPTGVEMEALTAASGAALTVYDMCKAVDRKMAITSSKVVYKSGGRSGTFAHGPWLSNGGKEFLGERGITKETSPGPEQDAPDEKVQPEALEQPEQPELELEPKKRLFRPYFGRTVHRWAAG